jgi:hypothetical protein
VASASVVTQHLIGSMGFILGKKVIGITVSRNIAHCDFDRLEFE